MQKNFELLTHLQNYLKSIQEAHEILCQYYQSINPIKDFRNKLIPRSGTIEYNTNKFLKHGFHGFGCQIILQESALKFDYEYHYDGKLDGFIPSFFFDYLTNIGYHTESLKDFVNTFADFLGSQPAIELFYDEWRRPFYRLNKEGCCLFGTHSK